MGGGGRPYPSIQVFFLPLALPIAPASAPISYINPPALYLNMLNVFRKIKKINKSSQNMKVMYTNTKLKTL